MLPRHLTQRWISILLVLPILTAVNCKKKVVEPPPPQPVAPQSIEVKLQVSGFSPSSVAPNEAFSGRVMGSGFEAGATVKIGSVDGEKVRVNDKNQIQVEVQGLPEGSYDVTVTNPGGESSTLRSGLTVKGASCKDSVVYFGFDQDSVNSDGKSVVSSTASCVQAGRGAVKVEGHTCELGTTEYNLALGQRRADNVRKALTGQGVSGSRITTVSYGEERPADRGHNDSAFTKNRRAEIHVAE